MLKKNFFVVSLFISLNSFAQLPQDSLLLYYPFNSNASDLSGNGFNGIVNGATLTADRFGNANSAYFFDGVNDFIDMPNVNQLKPQLPVSISLWVRLESLSQTDNQFFSTSAVNGNYAGCTFNTTSNGAGGLNINYGGNSGGTSSTNRRSKSVQSGLSIGTWHHIVGIFRGSTDMDIYIDGVLLPGTYSGSGGNIGYGNVGGSLGRANVTGLFYWGAIDDFAIYNKSLDSCEVQALYLGNGCNIVGLNNISASVELIEIFPNPSNGHFSIRGLDYSSNHFFRIYDNTGKLVYTASGTSFTDITVDLQAGIYHLQVQNQRGEIQRKKFLIK